MLNVTPLQIPMKHPLSIRLAPERAKAALYFRRYHPVADRWHPLFAAAPLTYAPGVSMELVPSDVMHGEIALTGFYELPLTRKVASEALVGGLMVDVGANAGYFSLLWAAGRASNECIAIEASPRNVALLQRNVEANNLRGRVTVLPVAAGSEAGVMRFDLGPPEQTGWGGLVSASEWEIIEVPVVRVDEVIGDRFVHFLKVDVEGADTWVLEGCTRALRDKRVAEIHFEQNRPKMEMLGIGDNQARDLLRDHGYDVHPLGDPAAGVVDWVARPRI